MTDAVPVVSDVELMDGVWYAYCDPLDLCGIGESGFEAIDDLYRRIDALAPDEMVRRAEEARAQ